MTFSSPSCEGRKQRDTVEELYAVIGESENYPILYHMNQKQAQAEHLRKRREESINQPCFIVPMSAWLTNPLRALRQAQTERARVLRES